MQKIIFVAFIMLLSVKSFSQTQQISADSSLIQLSGVVVTNDELEPMPYTTVFDKSQRRGIIADYYGYFSLVVLPGDTLYFSYYGYKTSTFIVPDTLEDNRYSIIHMLQKEFMQ